MLFRRKRLSLMTIYRIVLLYHKQPEYLQTLQVLTTTRHRKRKSELFCSAIKHMLFA